MLLLEREHELARVVELVSRAAGGEFGAVVVEGQAGAGKSAILGALSACAGERGMRVLRAAGLELETAYPFGVVRQLFEPAVYGLEPTARGEVFAGAAAFAEPLLSGARSESGLRLADPGFALLHGLYWVLVGLTDLGPVALVVDDVQWADRLSLRFLAFALRRSDGLPLLVALARRDPADGEQPDELATLLSAPASLIRPRPLSGAAIGVLLAGAVGRGLTEDVVAEAERLTEGNPLYVRELADALSGAGVAAFEDPLATLQAAAPAAVGRRVLGTLSRLDPATRALAQAAAILGDEVPLRHAALMGEVDEQRSSTAADLLARARILVAGEPLRFRHPLVREAVLGSIGPRARARAHARAGRLLIAEGEPAEHVALHFVESDPAGDPRVVGALRAAADRASAQAAPELAIRALRRALREPPEPAQRPLVLKELAMVEARLGDQEALRHFEEAFRTAESLEVVADGAAPYAFCLVVEGKIEEAEALIDRVLEAIRDRDRRLMLESELFASELFAWGYQNPAASERLVRVTIGLRGGTAAERLLLGLRACDAARAGAIRAAEAVGPIRAALGDGRLLAELGPESPTYMRMLIGLFRADGLDLLDRELAGAVAEARRRGASYGLALASTLRGHIAVARGELPNAEAEARTGFEITNQMGRLHEFPFPLSLLIEVLTEIGELDEAECLLHAHNFDGRLPEGLQFTETLRTRGQLRLARRSLEEGIMDLQDARARLDLRGSLPPVRASVVKALVPALVQAGRDDEAREIADEALRVAQAFGASRNIAHSTRARALAQTAGPNLDQLREAAAIYEQISARLDLARTLTDIGAALRRQRQPAAARDPLRRALDLARACGARLLAERAEHELRASGARPRRDRITGRDALTATELRIAQLATDGMSNRQIAETLFVTRKTVESHLEHIFRKLGIHARGELQRALAAQAELTAVN